MYLQQRLPAERSTKPLSLPCRCDMLLLNVVNNHAWLCNALRSGCGALAKARKNSPSLGVSGRRGKAIV